MNPHSTTPERYSVSQFLKRGTLLGAAMGMLVGLVYLGIVGVDTSREADAIIVWRNFILAGAFAGLLMGAGLVYWFRGQFPFENEENRADDANRRVQDKTP